MTESEILKAALDKFGLESQLDMVIEECAELIIAIQHYRRDRCVWDNVSAELADVSIVVGQLANKGTHFQDWKSLKLARLEKLLEDK